MFLYNLEMCCWCFPVRINTLSPLTHSSCHRACKGRASDAIIQPDAFSITWTRKWPLPCSPPSLADCCGHSCSGLPPPCPAARPRLRETCPPFSQDPQSHTSCTDQWQGNEEPRCTSSPSPTKSDRPSSVHSPLPQAQAAIQREPGLPCLRLSGSYRTSGWKGAGEGPPQHAALWGGAGTGGAAAWASPPPWTPSPLSPLLSILNFYPSRDNSALLQPHRTQQGPQSSDCSERPPQTLCSAALRGLCGGHRTSGGHGGDHERGSWVLRHY